MILKCFSELGHDQWRQLCCRRQRDVIDVCPVFQLCREPTPSFRQSHSKDESEDHRRFARTLQESHLAL